MDLNYAAALKRIQEKGMQEPVELSVSLKTAKELGMVNQKKESQSLGNAIADMKRQLRSESKSELIRQWIGLYAKAALLQKEVDELKKLIIKQESTNNETTASAVEGE